MQYDEGQAKLRSRARVATAMLWAFVAVAAISGLGEVLKASGTIDIAVDTSPLAMAIGLAYLAFSLVFLACVIAVAMWIHRAHSNLRDAAVDGLEFTPGWAVGWYFIPFANLVKPFQAMRELWNASHGEATTFGGEAPSEVKLWWGTWIAGNIVSNIGMRIVLMEDGGPGSVMAGNAIGAAGTALLMLAAVLLVRVIAGVTRAQRDGSTAVAVFA